MSNDANGVFFSVIMPTRNRPPLFEMALRSVLEQTFTDREVIVVNDGSTGDDLERYRALERQYPEVRFEYLLHRPNGHGQSYSMNVGAERAKGKYLAFLDDDDYWTDPNYLEQVHRNLSATGEPVDVHYANQQAFYPDGTRNTADIWVEDLIPRLHSRPDAAGDARFVDPAFLLGSKGFAHLNCSVFRRDFYLGIRGMDEGIRYECDRDIYLRSLDAAQHLLYSPMFMSYHRIPDARDKGNMSTLVTDFEKKLYQLRVYDKGILLSRTRTVQDFCRRAKTYELKNIATLLASGGDHARAAHYAREALLNRFNPGWLAYTLQLSARSLFR